MVPIIVIHFKGGHLSPDAEGTLVVLTVITYTVCVSAFCFVVVVVVVNLR